MKKSSIRRALSHNQSTEPTNHWAQKCWLIYRWKGKQPVVHTCSLVPSLLHHFSAGEGPGYEATHMFFSLNNKQQFFYMWTFNTPVLGSRLQKKASRSPFWLGALTTPSTWVNMTYSSSVLAYCKQFQTGQQDGLGTRLSTNTCWLTAYQ